MAADSQAVGHLLLGEVGLIAAQNSIDRGERYPGAPQLGSFFPSSSKPHASAIADQVSFELGDGCEHRQKQAGHCVSPGLQVDPLSDRDESDPASVELAELSEEIEGTPAETVQFPDDHYVELAAFGCSHDASESRPIVAGSAPGFLNLEHSSEPVTHRRLLELAASGVRVLIHRADAVVESDPLHHERSANG